MGSQNLTSLGFKKRLEKQHGKVIQEILRTTKLQAIYTYYCIYTWEM